MSPPYNSSPIVHSDTGQALAIATKALNIATTVLHSGSLESEGGAATLPPTKSTRRARQSERAKRTKRNNPSGVKTLSEATRGTLEQKLGHIFENPDFLWEALQSKGTGITQIGDRKIDDGNNKLALLGDKLIGTAIMEDWIPTGESRRDAHNTEVKIGNNRHLQKCFKRAGLDVLINHNPCWSQKGVPAKVMSATVEALIGAVYLDSGKSMKPVKVAMRSLGLYDA